MRELLAQENWLDRARWDEWEVPMKEGYPLLPATLANHHPYAWFDVGPAT